MFRSIRLEARVGLFIGLGIFLMFLLVFSISDIYFLKKGYEIRVTFDYVNGITENSPVRLAGVNVGEVRNINIFYDEARQKTRVRLDLWIEGDMKIETDSVARINQLGLLGEQYLELAPGVEKHFLASGSEINGKNPVNVGQQMEGIREFVESATNIMQHIEKGEGTLGKFVMDDALYDDLVEIFTKIKSGEGTLGKLLMDDTLYNEMEGFASDIKAHPWKLIHKTSDRKKKKKEEETPRGTEISVKE